PRPLRAQMGWESPSPRTRPKGLVAGSRGLCLPQALSQEGKGRNFIFVIIEGPSGRLWIARIALGQHQDTKEVIRTQRPLFTRGKPVDNRVETLDQRRRCGGFLPLSSTAPVGIPSRVNQAPTGYPRVFPRGVWIRAEAIWNVHHA